MRILSNADVEQLLSPQDVLDTLEVAYQEHSTGAAAPTGPRNHTYFPVEDARYPGFRYRFKSQEGGNVSSGVWATAHHLRHGRGRDAADRRVQRRRLLPRRHPAATTSG